MRRRGSAVRDILPAVKRCLEADANVRFAYPFGSQALNKATALSHIDIAVFLDPHADPFPYRLKLIETLIRITKTENIGVLVLNQAIPLLKHQIIGGGIVLKEAREERVVFEKGVLREYLDLDHLRKIQMSYIREQLRAGTNFG